MNPKLSIDDLPDSTFDNKRVLVRADLNVPMTPDHTITSDYRIKQTLPTLNYLLKRHAKIILVSHLGRPKGAYDPNFSLEPVVQALRTHLPGTQIHFVHAVVGPEVDEAVKALKPGEILVLENIRFEPGETKNDLEFSRKLASMTDVYVDDAFGAAHRAHSSTFGVAELVPVHVAGLLMKREIAILTHLLSNPEKPFTAIIGGSKISTKIQILSALLEHVNNIVIGGAMVFTFLKAKGYTVGNSLVEDEYLQIALDFLKRAEEMDKVISLPTDVVIADRFAPDAKFQTVSVTQIPEGWMGLDIGAESTARIMDILKNSKTAFWNGPLGVFEFPEFSKSTRAVADYLCKLTQEGHIISVLGGGDTEAALGVFNIPPECFTAVSTGGGAALELIEGKPLPGIEVLQDKEPVSTGAA